jgi:hypothetical protein
MSALHDMMAALYRAKGLHPGEISRRLSGDLRDTPDNVLNGKTPAFALATLETDWGCALICENLWSDEKKVEQ